MRTLAWISTSFEAHKLRILFPLLVWSLVMPAETGFMVNNCSAPLICSAFHSNLSILLPKSQHNMQPPWMPKPQPRWPPATFLILLVPVNSSRKLHNVLPDLTPFGVDISYTWVFRILEGAVITNAGLPFKLDTDFHSGSKFHTWHGASDASVSATIKKEDTMSCWVQCMGMPSCCSLQWESTLHGIHPKLYNTMDVYEITNGV